MASKKNRKPHFYWCELYKANFYFCVGWPRDEVKKYVQDEFDYETDFDFCEGKTIEAFRNNSQIILVWTSPADERKHKRTALVHECVHAACFALGQRGVGIDWPVCEPLTFMVENLFRQALKGNS